MKDSRFVVGQMLLASAMIAIMTVGAEADTVGLRPQARETQLGRAVILVPDDAQYRALGKELAAAIKAKTGVAVPVESAAGCVTKNPRAVKPEKLDRDFILLGQFWNNAVLERLYCRFYDPTDAVYPGPGGYELRTICSPFKYGQNCVVVTGPDLEGCRKAVAELPKLLSGDRLPFLHKVTLTGEAAELEKARKARMASVLAVIDRYSVFGHPQGRTWTGGDPSEFPNWNDRNLATAACFGLYYWLTGDADYGQAFKQIVLGCRKELGRLAQAYKEGRSDLMDYAGPEVSIAWSLIAETDLFTESERQEITDCLYQLAYLNREAYFFVRKKGTPLEEVSFGYTRHGIGGTSWFWHLSDYLLRNGALTDEQRRIVEEWHAQADWFLARYVQNPFYGDNGGLMHDEGEQMLRWSLYAGRTDWIKNGSLRLLADQWVFSYAAVPFSGTGAPLAGEVLNVAGWSFPGEGYQAYRRGLGRWPYQAFLFYAEVYGLGWNYYNWELPVADDGLSKLQARAEGVTVISPGKAYYDYLRRFGNGATLNADRYEYEAIPFAQTWKKLAIRSGLGAADQCLVLQGMQGAYASLDEVNAIIRYDDLGQSLLQPCGNMQTAFDTAQGRLGVNTLLVSRGLPGLQKQSVSSQLLASADLGPEVLLRGHVPKHDGVAWTRNLFVREQGWVLLADEVRSPAGGSHFFAQTWLSKSPFEIKPGEATAKTGEVTLYIAATPERRTVPAYSDGRPVGIREKVSAELAPDRPFTMWTLFYATGPGRAANWRLKRFAEKAALLTSEAGATLAFVGQLDLAGLHIRADMGLISEDRLTLAGCRELVMNGRRIYSSVSGASFGWNLKDNGFEAGKTGFGLRTASQPRELLVEREPVIRAIAACLWAASETREYRPGEVADHTQLAAANPLKPSRFRFAVPFSLATVSRNGSDELLLYDAEAKPRFALPKFRSEPVTVDFDGSGKPDIAFVLDQGVAVYHPNGALRWKRDFPNYVYCLSAGDLQGDGRQELGVGLNNNAKVLDASGNPLIDEEIYRYISIGGAFGDFAGDGKREYVAITQGALNSLAAGRPRQTLMAAWWSLDFGPKPCRLWLRDFDKAGFPNIYLGGAGSYLTGWDMKNRKQQWAFKDIAVRPEDAVLADVDGDGKAEFVSGGGDGFLYVVGTDGAFRFSRSVGEGIVSLAAVPAKGGDRVVAGLEDGRVLLLDHNLAAIGEAKVADAPITHLAVLRRAGGSAELIAADDSGQAIRAELP